jgi:AraC-like DNA-binding protein
MDPLSQLVRLAGPSQLNWKMADLAGDWTHGSPATTGIAFCLVVAGRCRAQFSAEGAGWALSAGDFLLLVRPPAWFLRADGEDGPATRLVGGHFRLDAANTDLLTSLLPASVLVRASQTSSGRIRTIVELIGDEAGAGRPGQALILERLIEVLVVEAARLEVGGAGQGRPGLLMGLEDARIAAALHAIHGDVVRNWTVAALAGAAGMSRSAFAERFDRLTGMPPKTYLLRWRMALAKDFLRAGEASLTEVAAACGYGSASAFSTAFARVVGCPPATFARGRRETREPAPTAAKGSGRSSRHSP